MMLLTKEIRARIPKLYEQDGKGEDSIAYVKFFDPSGSWTWFATEGQPDLDDDGKEIDFTFYGLVYGFEKEFGYFSLNELQTVKGRFGLGIERDLHFKPKPLKECSDPCGIHT